MTRLSVLDLFSGIGGFSLGLERTGGFETVAFCEIEEKCRQVLKKHWPSVPIGLDVTKIKGHKLLEKIDVICGGFPCQDISVAGLKKGITDETRSGLWYEYKRIIQEVKPSWVIIENVRNLLNNGLAIVLKDLHEVGYDAEWEIISARSVGAPHLRERIWIVAYPSRERLQRQWEPSGVQEKQFSVNSGAVNASDSNNFRFWPSFTTEKEKSEWWTEATASVRDRWEVEPTICRVDDGLSPRLDKGRATRIKQLGNSIIPGISEIIGNRILYYEGLRND